MALASVMPNKSTGHFLCTRVLAFLKEIGCDMGDLTVKSDQESAMQSVVKDVGKLRAENGEASISSNALPSMPVKAMAWWSVRSGRWVPRSVC